MTFSGPYEGIQRPYGRIWAGGEKKSKPWLPTGVRTWLPVTVITYALRMHSSMEESSLTFSSGTGVPVGVDIL